MKEIELIFTQLREKLATASANFRWTNGTWAEVEALAAAAKP